MIEAKLVRGGKIKLVMHAVFEKRLRQRHVAAHSIARHRAPVFLGALRFLRHADAERRQIVVEKIYEMIAVHFDDHIRLGLLHLLAHLFHQRFAFHFARRLLHLEDEPRRMRHAGGQNQFCHEVIPSAEQSVNFSQTLD